MNRELRYLGARYGVGVVVSGVALILTFVLWPMIQPSVFPLFLAAVMLSAWYGGLGPGLLATTLAVTTIDYFFLPAPSTRLVALEVSLRLGIFAFVALLISSLTAARQRAEADLRRAHDELEVRVQERTVELASTNEALRAEIMERKRTEQEKQKLLHALQKRVKELTVLHRTARQRSSLIRLKAHQWESQLQSARSNKDRGRALVFRRAETGPE